jgi:uncharacterized protein
MRSRRPALRPVTLVLALLLVPAGLARAAVDLAGDWSGALAVQGMQLHLVFHVAPRAEGGWSATMDSPDQGARGIPVDDVAAWGDSVRLRLTAMRAGFRGAAAGDTLRGAWEQGGLSLPLALARGVTAAPKRPQTPVAPFPYDTLEVVVPNRAAGITLAGTLTEPRGDGPFPAVVLLTGSGPQNRDEELFGHQPFRLIADALTRAGFAVLRTDDRGVGRSGGSFATATIPDFVADARAGLEFLATRREIDRARLGLLGHSEGGIEAAEAALPAKGATPVAFVVLLAGPGLPGDSILVLQSAALMRATATDESLVEWNRAFQHRLFDVIRAGGDTATVRRGLERAVDEALPSLPGGFREAVTRQALLPQVRNMTSPWFRSFLTTDPRPALRRLRCPVLAMIGAKDLQVPARQNIPALAEALKAGGNPASRAIEMPGLNHLFQEAGTGLLAEYAELEQTMAPAALDTLTTWLTARVAEKRR